MERKEALELLAALIQEEGYKASIVNDYHINTRMSGYTVLVFVDEPFNNIQLYVSFTRKSEEDFSLKHANAFNEVWRYTKCFIKENGVVAFEADFMIDLNHEDAQNKISRIIAVWESALGAGARATAGE